ncbi:MAG: hypothetical protein DRP61_03575 [Candidatus Omnitrophota bacterium]|nr:MAG: hypothetical protein DRP61_03575 [Candidatus Omnitrophota bacterium]RKY34939.1 MAG: hypothetical protein DRP69_03170 [Candidatus Omnitrophota bacterium]RKY43460.1 MAG: hypothetical protein DRP80_05135 [Candidatus Omnitrophota bacterium]
MLVDCHCHLSFPDFSLDLETLLRELKDKFYALIESSVNLDNTQKALETFSNYDFFYFSLGFHPHYAQEFNKEVLKKYADLINQNKKIVAIGEIGLDIKSKVSLDKQKEVFLEFLDLAFQFQLPVVIHNRGFKESILGFLQEKKIKKVVLHCFSQDLDFLEVAVKKNYFLSFSGNITYKNARFLRECVKKAPSELILSETDSPFLAPQIIRGKKNNPLYVGEVIKEIALLKDREVEDIEEAVLKNAKEVFRI